MLLIIRLRHPGTRDIRYFQTKLLFYFHMSIVNHFRKFYAGHHQKGVFRGDYLFVDRKRHAHVRSVFFHIKSWCRKTLHI